MVSCCQVEYDFDEIKYNAKSVKDVTVYANSQRIIQASVSHNNGKGEAALPPADQCYVTVNRSMGKIPLIIARSLDQLHSGTNQVNVMIMNPTNKDVNVSKGKHLTMLTPVPNYQKVIYSDGKNGPMHVISAINEGHIRSACALSQLSPRSAYALSQLSPRSVAAATPQQRKGS